jgi:hypothetical protein
MPKNMPEITEAHIVNALQEAIGNGWLGLVPYGYCFSCDGMGMVYEVTGKDIPAQPPRCEGCFIEHAYDLMEDEEAMANLMDSYNLLTLGHDNDGAS